MAEEVEAAAAAAAVPVDHPEVRISRFHRLRSRRVDRDRQAIKANHKATMDHHQAKVEIGAHHQAHHATMTVPAGMEASAVATTAVVEAVSEAIHVSNPNRALLLQKFPTQKNRTVY